MSKVRLRPQLDSHSAAIEFGRGHRVPGAPSFDISTTPQQSWSPPVGSQSSDPGRIAQLVVWHGHRPDAIGDQPSLPPARGEFRIGRRVVTGTMARSSRGSIINLNCTNQAARYRDSIAPASTSIPFFDYPRIHGRTGVGAIGEQEGSCVKLEEGTKISTPTGSIFGLLVPSCTIVENDVLGPYARFRSQVARRRGRLENRDDQRNCAVQTASRSANRRIPPARADAPARSLRQWQCREVLSRLRRTIKVMPCHAMSRSDFRVGRRCTTGPTP